MIVEDCKELSGRIADLKQLRLQVNQLRRFQTLRTILAGHLQRITPLLEVSRTLRATGIEDVRLGETACSVLEKVSALRVTYSERPDAIVDDRTVFSNAFRDELTGVANSLDTSLRSTWDRYTIGRVPATSLDVLNILYPAFPQAVDRIRALSASLESQRATLPRTIADVEFFNSQAASLQGAWQELDGGQIPETVLVFLRAAALPQGAAIHLLTTEVTQWLSQHNILRSFAVRIAS